ncbi:MAG: hypothetical protein WBQ04_06630 [Candidatus Acidiferrales bacterium]
MKPFGTRAVRAGSCALPLVAFAILSAAPNYSARSSSPPDFGSLPENAAFSHDAKGLENQYEPFLDAFAAVKPAEFHQVLAIFALPNPGDWFAKYFARDQVEQLVRQNESELNAYEQALLRSMAAVPPGTRFRVRCKLPHADPTTRISPRPDAILPSAAIPVEQFVTEFDSVPKMKNGRFSLVVNYVYVDGAFRYVGKGAYPFWTAPDEAPKKIDRSKFKSNLG